MYAHSQPLARADRRWFNNDPTVPDGAPSCEADTQVDGAELPGTELLPVPWEVGRALNALRAEAPTRPSMARRR